jgi:diguanylate cyclase (GGDEF)-like protein/PAS domain S-box-containing protein
MRTLPVHKPVRYGGIRSTRARALASDARFPERKNTENAITGSGVLQAVIASVAALINSASLDDAAPKALRMVGEALNVDRCIVIEDLHRPGSPPSMIPSYQWNKSGLAPLLPPFIAELLKHPHVLSWLAPLSENKPVVTTLANANATVKGILRALKSTSILLIPISVAGRNWGRIGLHDGTSDREWTVAEIEPLLAFATLFGVTIERGRQIQALAQERNFTAAVISGLPGFFVQFDERGLIVRCNENLSTVTGRSKEQLQGRDAFSLIVDTDRKRAQAKLADVFEKGFTEVEFGVLTKSGNVREFHWSARLITVDAQPNVLAAGIDITEARAAEMKLRESEERFRTLEKATGQLVWATDAHGEGLDSPDWRAFTGQSSGEITGYGWLDALHPDDRQQTTDAWSRALKERSVYTTEYRIRRQDGVYRRMSVRGVPILRQDGTIRDWIGTCTDITERSLMELKLTRMARHDLLTDLPNRATFIERLELAFAAARRGTAKVAVLFLDLDQFKDVNDTLGHHIGDLLLQTVSKRLQESIRESDTVARFGGDEFALINTDVGEPADAAAMADKVLKTFREPFLIQGNEIRMGASIGIAIYGLDATDPETLLSHADVALYRAKAEGRGTYRFFTDAMDTDVRTRVRVNAELRDAITSGQLFILYQPQVNVDIGHIIGVEALVRWQHPTRGILSPGEFIPMAEKSGLIAALGQWVLHEACRQMKEWLDAGIAPPLVAVNVSALQFKTPLALENDIAAILVETGLPPSRLELELTESVLMEVSNERNNAVQRLRKSGLRIAIDDFGTGYSSLDYLGRFPVDRIKIAQSFTINLARDSRNATIVKAAIAMAHELGLDVIVEGVETAEQLALIRSISGHKVQGFYFFKPLSAADVTALLRAGSPSRFKAAVE